MKQRMSEIRRMSRIAWLLILTFGLIAGAEAQDRKPLRLATLAPKGSSLHKSLQAMGEAWRNGPEGGPKLIIYPDGTMGGEGEMVRKMRIKQLQCGLLTVAGLEQIDPSVTALQNLPMVFRDLEEVAAVREALHSELEKRFEAKGFVLLFLGDVGFVRFFSKQPMRTPADLKRTKLFTQAGNTPQVNLMKSLGLNPQPLEPPDMFTSLQTGLIDCTPTIPFYAQISQIHKSAPYMLEMDWAPLVGGCVILKETFEAYPPALQASMRKSATLAGAEIQSRNRTENEESIKVMQLAGLKPIKPSEEELQQWRAFLDPVYPQLRGKQVPADLYDIVMKTLESHRAAKAGK